MSNALWGGIGGSGSSEALAVTGRSLIRRAYQMLGVIRSGQDLSSDQYADGLLELNQMLDSWRTDRLMVRAIERQVYDLTGGQMEYLLGDQGEQPTIEAASLLRSGSSTAELPLEVLTEDPRRTGKEGVYLDGGWPTATLVVYPEPTEGGQVALYVWRPVERFAELDTEYTLPPGFPLAIRFSLAAQLAPAAMIHTKITSPLLNSIEDKAREAKARIAVANYKVPELRADSGHIRWDGRNAF